MAKNDTQKLRDKPEAELIKELIKEKQRIQEMKFDLARGKVKNSAAVRESRRKIARLSTLLKEKENAVVDNQNEQG